MLVMALSLFFIKAEYAINLALAFIGIGMTLRGMGVIIYYLTMTRYMVGGRYTLYWGIIYLELGILSGSLAGHPAVLRIISAFRRTDIVYIQ